MLGELLMTNQEWILNLYNTATVVSTHLGSDSVRYILWKYGADSFESLSPIYYSEVFSELDFMASDLRD